MQPDHRQWNQAHLIALAALPAYAAAAQSAGWAGPVTLAVHLLGTLAWFAGFERWRPHREGWHPGHRDIGRDATFLGMNAVVDGLAGLGLASLALALGSGGPAASLPQWASVPLAVLLAEFCAYWLHRGLHRDGWGWRLHLVHHRPEALNVSNNLTTHPVNVLLLKAAQLLPLALLGFDGATVLLASLFIQLQSFAAHANTRGRMGWLNHVIGTAELHRWHHSADPGEALNFGTALPLWDQVFGTFRYRPRRDPQALGVACSLGVPEVTDTWGLVRFPFARRRAPPAT